MSMLPAEDEQIEGQDAVTVDEERVLDHEDDGGMDAVVPPPD